MNVYLEDDSTKLLIEETSKYKILGADKEREYFKEYRSTKSASRREYILAEIMKSNLRFVLTMAKDYHKVTGLPINDFYSEGKLGMLEAFYKYDYTSGVKFISFAVWEVRRHMAILVQNSDSLHIPVKIRKRVLDALKHGESIDSIQYGKLAANAIGEQTSLEAPAKKTDEIGNPLTVGDMIASGDEDVDAEYGRELVRERINEAMQYNLAPEESKLMKELFGLNGYEQSVADIAAQTNTSREQIRRIKNAALAKLRKSSIMEELNEELRS